MNDTFCKPKPTNTLLKQEREFLLNQIQANQSSNKVDIAVPDSEIPNHISSLFYKVKFQVYQELSWDFVKSFEL